jgi:hypothetical protein
MASIIKKHLAVLSLSLLLCPTSFADEVSFSEKTTQTPKLSKEQRFITAEYSQKGLGAQFSTVSHKSIDDKIQFLLDREEITAVIKYYALTMDSRDWDFQRELFTERHENYKNGKFVSRSIDDRIALREQGAVKWASTQHMASVYSINIDGNTAFVKSTLHARHFPEGGKRSQERVMIGQYRYVLKKTSKGWKINIMRLVPSRKK